MKVKLCTILGTIGACVASLFGGWDASIITLLFFMGVDYISGLIVAGVFKVSPKTATGALESRVGFKGLCRKGMILLLVLVATRLDINIGTSYIRDGVCIAFIANELISIIENAGLMGIQIPKALQNAIDILKKEGDDENE